MLILQEQDYNVASSEVSPLQHLWSMSVQGQFYLFGILLALFLATIFTGVRRVVPKVAGGLFLIITVLSFWYATQTAGENQSLNYYSTFARAWEISLGAVLAIYTAQLVLPRMLREILVALGLVMVLTTGVLFDGATDFPGPAALYPLGGAALIIVATSGHTTVGKTLDNAFMQWLGRIAYGFYVWHWPILIAATVLADQARPAWWIGLIVLAISLLMADLNHRFIESPLRQHRRRPVVGELAVPAARSHLRTSRPAQVRAGGGVLVGLISAGLFLVVPMAHVQVQEERDEVLSPAIYPGAAALAGADVPDAEARPSPLVVSDLYPVVGRDGCMSFRFQDPDRIITHQHADPSNPECIYGDPDGEITIYLIGGSHAEQWSTPLHTIARDHGIRLIPLLRQGCPFVFDDGTGVVAEDCQIFNTAVLDVITENPPDAFISTSTRPSNGHAGPDHVPPDYALAFQAIDETGIPYLGLRDNPWATTRTSSPPI